jgi:hypothetical protein
VRRRRPNESKLARRTALSVCDGVLERLRDGAPSLEVERGRTLTQRRTAGELAAGAASGIDLEEVVDIETLAFAASH